MCGKIYNINEQVDRIIAENNPESFFIFSEIKYIKTIARIKHKKMKIFENNIISIPKGIDKPIIKENNGGLIFS